ncbi:MAG: zinc-ribbon domain-containing protein [Proteobacteria bacterium]|nr:zinc-ribbon domain-containing protein [Pseudomonadota bacterium]
MANNCPMCGTPNEEDAPFCVACGSPLSSEAEPQKQKPQPASVPATAQTVYGIPAGTAPASSPEQPPAQIQKPPMAKVSAPTQGVPATASPDTPLENKKTVLGVMSPIKKSAVAPPKTSGPSPDITPPPWPWCPNRSSLHPHRNRPHRKKRKKPCSACRTLANRPRPKPKRLQRSNPQRNSLRSTMSARRNLRKQPMIPSPKNHRRKMCMPPRAPVGPCLKLPLNHGRRQDRKARHEAPWWRLLLREWLSLSASVY